MEWFERNISYTPPPTNPRIHSPRVKHIQQDQGDKDKEVTLKDEVNIFFQ